MEPVYDELGGVSDRSGGETVLALSGLALVDVPGGRWTGRLLIPI
jgi:hypothetical protein